MNRSTIILLALLVILAVAAFLLWPSAGEREASYDSTAPELSIDSAAVTKIEIRPPGKSVTLENVGGTWMVTSPVRYKANVASVQQLIGSLAKFKPGSLVSSNPDKQSMFQVDSAAGTHIAITPRTGAVVSLIVGKMGPSFSEVYFRLPDSKDVYLGDGLSSWTLTQDVKEWRDRSIVSMPQDSVSGIEIASGKRMVVLEKRGTAWYSGADTVAPSTVAPVLASLTSLRAEDFLDQPPRIETSPVSVKITGPFQVILDFYPLLPDSAKYAVKTSSSAQMYSVPGYTARQIIDLTSKISK